MDRVDRPSILEVNILFLFLGLVLWILGSMVQGRELYSGLLITEYILILLPNIMYLKLMGYSLRRVLRLNKLTLKQIVYIILITFCAYPIAVFFNFIMTMILGYFGSGMVETVPMADNSSMYFISLFVIALAPGICEEIMFRGSMLSAYEELGVKKGIIYSAILFGVFHLNLQNLLGPIVLGVVLGTTVYKTNSIYASIIGHTVSNSIAVTIGYLSTKALENMPVQGAPELELSNNMQILIMGSIFGIVAIVATIGLVKLIKGLPEGSGVPRDKHISRNTKTIHYIPIFILIILYLYININIFFIGIF